MVGIDTNALARWLNGDVESQAVAVDGIFAAAEPRSICLDRIILAELSYILHTEYQRTRPEMVADFQTLLEVPALTLTDRQLTRLMLQLFELHPSLDMEDCWLLALKHAGEVDEVITFDKALKKRLVN